MSDNAKIFQHGRSQAIRLPKAYRFSGTEVRVSKVGDTVILEPIREEAKMPWALLDHLGDSAFLPEGRQQPSMPTNRMIFE